MTLDRRSFHVGLVAGLLLFAGLIAGILLTVRFGWQADSHAQEPARLPLPASAAPANFVPVVKAATPAVVNIATTRTVKQGAGEMQSPFMDDPFFRHFFGDEFARRFQVPRERRENSLGSGVIVDTDGYIVTNNHVVA
jgi:serine protease Do